MACGVHQAEVAVCAAISEPWLFLSVLSFCFEEVKRKPVAKGSNIW